MNAPLRVPTRTRTALMSVLLSEPPRHNSPVLRPVPAAKLIGRDVRVRRDVRARGLVLHGRAAAVNGEDRRPSTCARRRKSPWLCPLGAACLFIRRVIAPADPLRRVRPPP